MTRRLPTKMQRKTDYSDQKKIQTTKASTDQN